MMPNIMEFAQRVLPGTGEGLRVLEIGARDVNGSVRGLLPGAAYIGVDIEAGAGVDEVCDGADVVRRFGVGTFDLVVCTETLEHVERWRAVVDNIKGAVREGGYILVTTCSPGFPFHAYPHDYWRFTLDVLADLFGDFDILAGEMDQSPSVMLYARKPTPYIALEPTLAPSPV